MKKINEAVVRLGNIVEKNNKIVFAMILLLAIVLNIYKIDEVPKGIHVDEAGMVYNAYCLANYGVDRFLNRFPVFFVNFGGCQSALYGYLTAILIKIFGTYNMFILRMPALILSVIEVIVAYLLVKEFYSKKQALLFMLLVTISPWHIMKSRWGLEAYLLSPMLLFSIYALIRAVKGNKQLKKENVANKKTNNIIKFIIAGTLFGLTLYTYVLSYIIVPIFLLLMLIYLIKKKQINIKQIIAFTIPLMIFAVPLILMNMVQKGWINEIHSFISIPKMDLDRINDINISKIRKNLSYFKFVFWDRLLTYNSIKGYSTLYHLGTILMVIGLCITIVKLKVFKITITHKGKILYSNNLDNKNDTKGNNQINLDTVMLFVFLSNIILAPITELNVNRANGIFISATYFVLVSLRSLYKNAKITFSTIMIIYAIMFVMFIKQYFVNYAKEEHRYFDNGQVELCRYLRKFDGKEIYTQDINLIYNLYANPISPYEFYDSIERGELRGEKRVVMAYKGFHRYIDWNNIKDDAVYVVFNQSYVQKLMDKGFKLEKFYNDRFNILYK